MANIEVRAVVESDYNEWLELFNLHLQFYKSSLPQDVKVATFKRCLDPNVDMFSAIAIHPETKKPIGLINYLKQLNTWSIADKIYLNDLYVDESSRLNGVGRALMEYVFARADEMGTPEVYWLTDMDNHRAQLLYTKVGSFAGKVVYKRTLPTAL